MPYRVIKQGKYYRVQVKRGSRWVLKSNKKYKSKSAAEKYKRALYANEPK